MIEVRAVAGTLEDNHTVLIFGHMLSHSLLFLVQLHQLVQFLSVRLTLHLVSKGLQLLLQLSKCLIIKAKNYLINKLRSQLLLLRTFLRPFCGAAKREGGKQLGTK